MGFAALLRIVHCETLDCNIGALIIRIGGSFKGFYKGSITEFYDSGALIIRIGFYKAHDTISIIRNPPK